MKNENTCMRGKQSRKKYRARKQLAVDSREGRSSGGVLKISLRTIKFEIGN